MQHHPDKAETGDDRLPQAPAVVVQKSEAAMRVYYQRMVEEATDYALLLLDVDGNILNWNPGAAKIKGYAEEEIMGRNFSIFYQASDIADGLPQRLISEAARAGKASHEGWRVKRDGTKFWGSIVITALHDTDNAIIGFSKITRDLTERRNAEENLQRYAAELQLQNERLYHSEQRYHRMIAEVEDYAIILLDSNGLIQNWNKGAENIKGYAENEIIGKSFRAFYLPEDREKQLPEHLLEQARLHNKANHEGWRLRKNGTRFWGSVVITALHDDAGSVVGFSKVTRDLTHKKEAEDLILQKNKQLEDYAHAASHDLQEPLRKILLFSDLLQRNMGNRAAAETYLQKINNSTERMSHLIKAVLEYSQTPVSDNLKAFVDLNDVIRNIEVDFELLLEERNGRILRDRLPVIFAIPIQMHQLFTNLISNAIKFCDGTPQIDIRVQQIDDIDSAKLVHIRVTDNGTGFKQEHADKIFRMFHRLHDKKHGTGIGLALCKRIVENHRGKITAISEPGKGTSFDILLPLE
ncbi:PAS domain-containing sensor histidine kinase [Flavobacterium sp. BFFFF1]|uniref:sensor histidine kinase n=1 Tax=Flavobacterium sp. BFFFF1 TaxID=2015557 RepID=UPI0025BE657B|nr:PAS domain-containing sensor histidine kinase [Flavobacterium sp. BFFFF1]